MQSFANSENTNPWLDQCDSLLFHVSGLFGVMAMAMTITLTYGVMTNTNRIESTKDEVGTEPNKIQDMTPEDRIIKLITAQSLL